MIEKEMYVEFIKYNLINHPKLVIKEKVRNNLNQFGKLSHIVKHP